MRTAVNAHGGALLICAAWMGLAGRVQAAAPPGYHDTQRAKAHTESIGVSVCVVLFAASGWLAVAVAMGMKLYRLGREAAPLSTPLLPRSQIEPVAAAKAVARIAEEDPGEKATSAPRGILVSSRRSSKSSQASDGSATNRSVTFATPTDADEAADRPERKNSLSNWFGIGEEEEIPTTVQPPRVSLYTAWMTDTPAGPRKTVKGLRNDVLNNVVASSMIGAQEFAMESGDEVSDFDERNSQESFTMLVPTEEETGGFSFSA